MPTDTQAKHTDGPWRASESVVAAGGRLIADCQPYNAFGQRPPDLPPVEESKANARVMAAAPDLADALADVRELLIYARCEDRYPFSEEEEDAVLSRASDALEKAAGPKWWQRLGKLDGKR